MRFAPLACLALVGCASTTGRGFMAEPLPDSGKPAGEPPPTGASAASARDLGTFRNTYYDFPSESDYSGETTVVRGAQCEAVATVPKSFFSHLCVQGSGKLADGATLSFKQRDVACADVCPRTGSKIAFERLDPRAFPWGRGAAGRPIRPLRSLAVDPEVIPLGTAVYLPDYDGARGDGLAPHDGCFVAEDRGSRVKGKHLDVFTGTEAMTKVWNERMPSNRGVRVWLGVPKCARWGWAPPP